MAGHTPGPWEYDPYKAEVRAYDGDTRIASQHWHGHGLSDEPEFEANGRLMAASPDLLAAAEAADEQMRAWFHILDRGGTLGDVSAQLSELSTQLTAAIRKATGEETTR